jgi:catechol-2,3-dioxygenase
MKIQSLGHVVLNVRNIEKAEAFYQGILGLPIAARMAEPEMTFFSLGNHHDFAIAAVGDDADSAPQNTPGLAHVAFKIGDASDELRAAKTILDEAGIKTTPVDHEVTQSLYMNDPDGNTVEVYVDVSDAWKAEPARVAQARPLSL